MKLSLNKQYAYFKINAVGKIDIDHLSSPDFHVVFDGSLDAPEAIPTGGLTGKDRFGYDTKNKWFSKRGE